MIFQVRIEGQGEHGGVWHWLGRAMREMLEMGPVGPWAGFDGLESHVADPQRAVIHSIWKDRSY